MTDGPVRVQRTKRDTINPCAVCGWSEHMAIHQPPLDDPDGKPWGHAYQPAANAPLCEPTDRREG